MDTAAIVPKIPRACALVNKDNALASLPLREFSLKRSRFLITTLSSNTLKCLESIANLVVPSLSMMYSVIADTIILVEAMIDNTAKL